MPNWLKIVALLGAVVSALPAWSLEDSDSRSPMQFAQPAICNRAWLTQYCPAKCEEAAQCREAIIDHRLEASDCMDGPIKASEKIVRGCGECNQVFCP